VKRELRSGYTTGACAAAAAKGAALMLVCQRLVNEVTIDLPGGRSVSFQLHNQVFSDEEASCHVLKDAGDDPDITNGAEIKATVAWRPVCISVETLNNDNKILISGGIGIGKVTKPGLAIPPGEWAINPVPRQMIREAVDAVTTEFKIEPHSALSIVLSIPDGEERAKRTLNARLGIIGGLSILGTTGIVRPISAKAWTDTIGAAVAVAKACNCKNIVFSTGRTSELAAQKHLPDLPEEAFIMMGDHVAFALKASLISGYTQPIIACQFAKMLKIACGYENTHAAASALDLAVLYGWAESAKLLPAKLAVISQANTAREIAVTTGFDEQLMNLVADRARLAAARHSDGIQMQPLLCGYDNSVVLWR
jgi:cobalt-precorrin-5B (C1)-methyltransferase